MIELEELIIQLCKLLNTNLSLMEKKPEDKKTIKYDLQYVACSNGNSNILRQFQTKIWVNNEVVFLQSMVLNSSDDLEKVKEKLLKNLISEIFNYGIISAHKNLPK